jgi:hypothetical protein
MGNVVSFPKPRRTLPDLLGMRLCPGCGCMDYLWEARNLIALGVVNPIRCFDCMFMQVPHEDFLSGAVCPVPTDATQAAMDRSRNPVGNDGDTA